VGNAHQDKPATIAELGLTKQHNRDFKDMAAVPAEIIHQTVEAANAKTPQIGKLCGFGAASRPRARGADVGRC
jgi:hypothetical protein